MTKIDITKTELVWPGKYNEDGTRKEVPRVNLPFQVIETVNVSRATREANKLPQQNSLFDVYDGKEGDTFEAGYLKPSGAIGFYHPDWVVVQKTKAGEVNWIIETKGREWKGTDAKDEAITEWCERITETTGSTWRFVRVNQADFETRKPATVAALTVVL